MSIIYEALKKIESHNPDNNRVFKAKDAASAIKDNVAIGDQDTAVQAPEFRYSKWLFPLKIVAVILIIALGVLAAFLVFKPKAGHRPAASDNNMITISPLAPSTAELKKPPSQQFVLEGIVYDPKLPLAVINGRVYKHYERLGDYMIVDISEREVTLRNINDESLLHLALPF